MTAFLYQRSLIMDVLASQESQHTYGTSEKEPSGCPSAGGVLPVEMAASRRGGLPRHQKLVGVRKRQPRQVAPHPPRMVRRLGHSPWWGPQVPWCRGPCG